MRFFLLFGGGNILNVNKIRVDIWGCRDALWHVSTSPCHRFTANAVNEINVFLRSFNKLWPFYVFLRLNKKVNVINYEYEKYTTDDLFSCTFIVVWTRLYVSTVKQAYFENSAGD